MFECKLSVSIQSIEAAREAAAAINTMLADDKHSAIKGAIEAANKAVTAANNAIAAEVYAAILGTDNPIKTAIEAGTIPAVHLAVDQKAGTYSIKDDVKIISLSDLEKRSKTCITAEAGWAPAVGLAAWRVVAGVRKGVNASDESMLRYVNELNDDVKALAPNHKPSKKAIAEDLQACLDKIIFEARPGDGANVYQIKTHDVRFFEKCMDKEGKGINGLAVSRGSTVERVMFKIAHRVVCNLKGYELEV